ncbi:MAG: 2-succinyl-5-enolpyruvyl-6-hydroxy-3-cyclohexene-1-carboxylic-acid synthase [Marinifilaceae bacterium]
MDNIYSQHPQVNSLLNILEAKGIDNVVLSPGSRNAPLLVTFHANSYFKKHIIVDERSAAFFALGIAQQTQRPAVLTCTSGTAMLNYAPAIAEAYYQGVPLVILTADRPTEWLNQDDSQIIEQQGVLKPYVKASYQLPVDYARNNDHWYTNRVVNEAINLAMSGQRGPVHINIPLDEPLYNFTSQPPAPERVITSMGCTCLPNEDTLQQLRSQLENVNKVMLIAGFAPPCVEFEQAVKTLANKNIVVLTETVSNLQQTDTIANIDRTLSAMTPSQKEENAPELLFVTGGAIVSRQIKAYIRLYKPKYIWYIGQRHEVPDGYMNLTNCIACNPGTFFNSVMGLFPAFQESYQENWQKVAQLGKKRHNQFVAQTPWSDLTAFNTLAKHIPEGYRIQVGNGTAVRYMQLIDMPVYTRMDCNRGTSGIDGSTSTAFGAANVDETPTLFISGDNSFLYDSNALGIRPLPANLKLIVVDNGGGGIFRFLPGSSDMECVEELFQVQHHINLTALITLYGIPTCEVTDTDQLIDATQWLFYKTTTTAAVVIKTDSVDSGAILKDYFKALTTENSFKTQ